MISKSNYFLDLQREQYRNDSIFLHQEFYNRIL